MKILGTRHEGDAKFYYAAPKIISETINNDDLPEGLKKEFKINSVAGCFNKNRETFTLSFNFYQARNENNRLTKYPQFEFQFNDNDIENKNKNVFYAKLKPFKKYGCIVSGLLTYKEHKWLFIAKFSNLIIPENFKSVKDDISYDDF